MKFKDILVHIDPSASCAARLDLAASLARAHGAHLTGIYPITHTPYTSEGDKLASELDRCERIFLEKTATAGIQGTWFPVHSATVGTQVPDILSYYAFARDLLVVGQTGPGRVRDIPEDLPAQMVAATGRPVLVVPYAGSFESVGRRVVIAWKRGKASARAVNDALPFLLDADEVFVLCIENLEKPAGRGSSEEDVVANLKRHGVKVSEKVFVMRSIPVAKILMDFAWENGCDLIVTGVNGPRSRGKLDLGPVADMFFENMTVPVLMSY